MSDIVMPNDQCVRSTPMTPMSMSSVSWFEFLLDEHRLDNHLQQENPGNFFNLKFNLSIHLACIFTIGCSRNVQCNANIFYNKMFQLQLGCFLCLS